MRVVLVVVEGMEMEMVVVEETVRVVVEILMVEVK